MAHTSCIVISVNDDETNKNRTSDNDSYLSGESQKTHDNNNLTATKISTGLFNSSEQNGGA